MENSQTLDTPCDLPPLRIHHFLTWMFVAAFSFSLLHVVSNRIGYDLQTLPLESSLPFLFQTLAVSVLGYTVYWCQRRHRFLEEPGQGLVLLVGIHFLWDLSISLPLLFFPAIYSGTSTGVAENWFQSLLHWGFLALTLIEILIWVLLYLRFLKVSGWRTYFLAMSILQLAALVIPRLLKSLRDFSPLLARLNTILYPVPIWILHITAVVGLAYLVIRDLHSSNRHHWSHWCGVLCALLVGIRDLNMSIMQMMMQIGWMQN